MLDRMKGPILKTRDEIAVMDRANRGEVTVQRLRSDGIAALSGGALRLGQ